MRRTISVIIVTLWLGGSSVFRAQAEVLYDLLCMVDDHEYEWALSSYCGGEDVFGVPFDLQAADDFSIDRPYFITAVIVNYVTWLGECPNRICLSVFLEEDCRASNEAVAYLEDDDNVVCEPFDDGRFGLRGLRIATAPSSPIFLGAGTWFLSCQPFSGDWGYAVAGVGARRCAGGDEFRCGTNYRDGGDYNRCCDGQGSYGHTDWRDDNPSADNLGMSLRIEGIPAGDCVDGEIVSATCKVRDGVRRGRVVVKISGGQPNGTVTALLDPPDPRSMSIALDGSGRGKGKFRGVPLGEHRVFVCDSIVDVPCAP